ncbi:hypothetical protein RQP46_010568 [Phenoliferia psychrophenolica]
MNSLYTLALRQSASIQTDLTALEASYGPSPSSSGTSTPASALNGQITASLAALDRTVDDYDNMARREIVEVKRDKALSRVARFREDYASLRKQHDRTKSSGATQRAAADRDLLFSSSSALGLSSSASMSMSMSNRSSSQNPRYPQSSSSQSSNQQQSQTPPTGSTPFTINMNGDGNGNHPSGAPTYRPNSPYNNSSSNGSGGGGGFGGSIHDNARTKHALGENDFLHSTGATLDQYIAQGQAVLGNLAMQRDMLKGTKRRLLSAANTLGLSRSTIQYIERRTKGDFYILLVGGAFTLFSFYLILKYFG